MNDQQGMTETLPSGAESIAQVDMTANGNDAGEMVQSLGQSVTVSADTALAEQAQASVVNPEALEANNTSVGAAVDVATSTGVRGTAPLDADALVTADDVNTIWLDSVIEILTTGGPVVMVLLGLSVVALTLVLFKLAQFQRARLWQRKAARQALELWQQGQVEKALALADKNANPTAQALARAIRGRQRQLPEVAVREEVLRYGSDALFQLRRGFRPLEVIGSLAPLLGLLGTVMGMISAFQQLEAAGNKVNPAILSGGIWEALLTTAVGLCVAIPVVALLNWLERSVDHLAHEMDNLVTQVFTEDLSAASESSALPVQPEKPAAASVKTDLKRAQITGRKGSSDTNSKTRSTTDTAHAAGV